MGKSHPPMSSEVDSSLKEHINRSSITDLSNADQFTFFSLSIFLPSFFSSEIISGFVHYDVAIHILEVNHVTI
ncbi:MAG TPA: hypothetical protein VJZ03_02490 [Candidatus Bathyarchaeia archaeon]|nr:hypothetical protein [Candidatus Bathyarchaeia archaeon]